MAKIEYPLQQVVEIKLRRVEEAQRVVKKKQEELDRQEKILREKEAERDKVLEHKKDKLQQLRDEMGKATTTAKIQQMKDYLKVVDGKLQAEEKKVKEQKEQVKKAQDELKQAREDLKLKELEVDKLEMHKKEWEEEIKRELEIEEGKEMDELGTIIYQLHKRSSY